MTDIEYQSLKTSCDIALAILNDCREIRADRADELTEAATRFAAAEADVGRAATEYAHAIACRERFEAASRARV